MFPRDFFDTIFKSNGVPTLLITHCSLLIKKQSGGENPPYVVNLKSTSVMGTDPNKFTFIFLTYALWSASIGCSFDAFAAGYEPKSTPMTAQNNPAAVPIPQFMLTAEAEIRL